MLDPSEVKDIQKAIHDLITRANYDDAIPLVDRLLEENPNDAIALNFMGFIAMETKQFPLAYQLLRRAVQESPTTAPIWNNFGLSAHELNRNEEAMSAYLKAAELNHSYAKPYANASAILVEESKWDDAEKMANMALEIDPKEENAAKNLAHVYLAKHDWERGWKHWELSLGGKFRKEWVYGKEPRWDGKPVKTLVIYGEQGLGDEINYASCIPDAIEVCEKVIVDCDPRLETLFRRSFPKAKVYGTRREQQPKWLQDVTIDARCAMSSLPALFRKKDEDFPGTPYLRADPELRKIWRSYFDGKPAYGLCFKSGSKYSGAHERIIPPDQFSPLFRKDAMFISLEYKDDVETPIIKSFPWVAKAANYDVTAALIAELTAVIGVHTTALHCANGLGVKTHILLPEHYQWRYEGRYVWSKTAKLHHKKPTEAWRDVIRRIEL